MLPGMKASDRPTDRHHDQRDAMKRLESLGDEPTFLGSSLAAAGRRAARHFAGQNPDDAPGAIDPIELWGRRIGRALSLIVFVGLAVYLYLTYVR